MIDMSGLTVFWKTVVALSYLGIVIFAYLTIGFLTKEIAESMVDIDPEKHWVLGKIVKIPSRVFSCIWPFLLVIIAVLLIRKMAKRKRK